MIIAVVILSLILLLLIKNHFENFIVNPNKIFNSGSTISKMRKFRECKYVIGKDACILSKKPFLKKYPPDRIPFYLRVDYGGSQDVRHLMPQRRVVI